MQNENARTSENKKQLQKCKFLFSQALNEDEAGHKEEAVKLYTEAVEVGLSAVSVLVSVKVITLLLSYY